MKGNRAALTAIVILFVIVVGWWLFHRAGAGQPIDLMTRFDQAEKTGTPYAVEDSTLAGDMKKSIAAPANGRLIFRITVPQDGWLKVALGLKPEAWDKEGNGVYFFVGVSDGRAFEQLFNQTVNPYQNQAERRWIPVMVDLSAYAGQDMQLIFNTRSSGPGQSPDDRNDLPLWGAPEIVTR
jgi:hypothetical protein